MSDPIRLRDPRAGASPELRDLLAAGRSELPDAKRLSAIAGRLGLVSPIPGRIDVLAHGASKWLGTGAAKVGAGALLVGLGTAAAVAGRGHRAPTAPEAPAVSLPAAPATVAPPNPDEAPEPSVLVPAPPRSSSIPHPIHAARALVVASATPTATAPASTGSESPPEHPPGWAPSTWGSSLAPAPPAPASDSLDPLQRAERELPENPSRALELALRDELSSNRLDEQRDVVIIEALVKLGRMAEARERAARFLRIFPGSPRRREVADLVGFDPGSQNR